MWINPPWTEISFSTYRALDSGSPGERRHEMAGVQLSPGAAGQKTRALAKIKVVLPTFSLASVHTRNIKYLNGGQTSFQDQDGFH